MTANETTTDVLTAYRIRTVRVAVMVTLLALGCLVALPFVPGHPHVDALLYGILLVVAGVGVGVAAALPWPRLFEAGWGERLLYVWSALDIALVTLGAALTGGPRSDVVFFYALTTLFFAASYPPIGQVGLMAFTCLAYLLLWALWHPQPPVLPVFLRMATLFLVWAMTAFLATEREREMVAHARSRRLAEHRAALLSAVARTATAINTLDAELVIEGVTESLTGLGFEVANCCVISDDGRSYRVTAARGLPPDYTGRPQSTDHGMVALVRERRGPVVVEDYGSHPMAVPSLASLGIKVAIGAPVWVGGRLSAVLIGGKTATAELSPTDAEAFGLLAGQVGRALENAGQYQAQRRLTDAANRASVIDELTGVGNRRWANTLLRGLRPSDAVVIIDLDHFKDVNDRHGHGVGDETLRRLATFLQSRIRDQDEVARYGGEEFLLVLRQAGDTALSATDRLLVAWREVAPDVTFSAGVALHGPDDTPEKTVGRADAAMYAAKQTGRDRACEFSAGLEELETY
ncbi:MAG TPA: sensor domain-containing diguanylate cyclase [Acidimicrobiales bacterium]|nr:sensor domain-containing diguanylate cyclase [Acidimicrobiales bacterium]